MNCPTPDKKQFRSRAEAARWQRDRYVRPGEHKNHLYPYECPGGEHWHLTHRSPEKQAEMGAKVARRPKDGLSPVANMFDGHQVRHVLADEPIWIARDVCDAVGISKYRDAVAQLDKDERVYVVVDTPGGAQQMSGVTEAGIWSLLMISRSEKAKPFKRWLTHEVLPTIRKTGRYESGAAANIALPDRKTLAQWVVDAETRAEVAEAKAVVAEAKVVELAPSASAWNELAESAGDYDVGDAAKVLSRDPAISIGRDRLFTFMRAEGWVFRGRGNRWRAYQNQVDLGRLVEKVGKPFWHQGRGEMVAGDPTVRITPKGVEELHRRLGGGAAGSAQMALLSGGAE